ncbi:MAG: alpha/beta hydrolase [Chrysiogenetes bacterium]|nr:alpha/beta hydrolase [Chrysiogenetes bacterium]
MSYYEKLPESIYWNVGEHRVHLACAAPLVAGRRTLLAVHGAGGSAWVWGELGSRLAGKFNFAAIELPGHGASEGPALTDIGSMVAVVAGAAERLVSSAQTPPPIVMGHSMGGAISIDLALSGAAELSGLVLVATGARLKVQPTIIEGIESNWEASCRSEEGFGPEAPRELKDAYASDRVQGSPGVAASDFRACNVFDRMADLGRITLPTLVFGGGKDLLTPEKYARYLSERIPGAKLVILENAGHMLPIEEPGILAAQLDAHFPDTSNE